MPTTIHGTNGITFNDGSIQTSRAAAGFRNRIINGDMRIWQRGGGSSLTNAGAFMADRMYLYSGVFTGTTVTALSPTGLAGFPWATRIQRNGGNAGTADIAYVQVIETANCQDLAGTNVTVSFYARCGANYSPASNALNVLLSTGTGEDQGIVNYINTQFLGYFSWTGLSTVTQQAFLGTSWARYTFSYYVSSNVNEIALAFNSPRTGVAGGSDYFDITGIQLEAGSGPTEFERRPIGTELALCQRYYQKTYELGTAPGTATDVGAINYIATSSFQDLNDRLMVEMRAVPSTVSIITPTGVAGSVRNYSNSTNYAATINGGLGRTSSKQTVFRTSVPATGANELSYHLTVDAEL